MLKRITGDGLPSLAALTVVATLVSFVFPLTLGAIVDRVVPHRAVSTLQVIVFVLIVAGLFEALVVMLRGQLIAFKVAQLTANISQDLITTMFRLPNADLLGEAGQQLTSHVVTLNLFRDHCREFALFILQAGFTSVVFSIALFILNVGLFTAVIIGFLLHFLIYFALRPFVKSVVRASVAQYARFNTSLQSNVQAIETLRAFGLSSRVARNVQTNADQALLSSMNASKTTMVGAGVSKLISRIVETVVIFIGTASVMRGEMTLGELITFQMFAARLFEPLSRLPNAWEHYQAIQQHSAVWSGILARKTLENKERITRFVVGEGPVLRLQHVGFRYPAREPVFEGFSLTIQPGEVVFLLGPSGSGKSTLVRLLTGLLRPDEGQVEIYGNDIGDIGETVFKKYVSCALQEPVLIPGSVAQNIAAFDDTVTPETIAKAVEEAHCGRFIHRLPHGLDTPIGEHGFELSGGERQRLCLARMLAADGALMIMDEATTGLDRELEIATLTSIVAQRKPWQALLIITHREDLAQIGTRRVRLDEGRIVSDRQNDGSRKIELV